MSNETGLKRGRKPAGDHVMTSNERVMKHRKGATEQRNADIAVLDFETDKFDNGTRAVVFPFLAVLYTRQLPTVTIWEDDPELFIEKVLAAILALPRQFTIYAHNGGKFDFMFFVHKLRGEVMFKGRGIMSAKVGPHDLRDSFHLIPERLASYKKDDFDYSKLDKDKRHAYRDDTIRYCVHDCMYLYDILSAFVGRFGRKLSIGQAASAEVKKTGIEVGRFNDNFDAYIRNFYFGGRVECLAGIGHFVSTPGCEFKVYDVNSMYPTAMRDFQHPIGGPQDYVIRTKGIRPETVFLDITCDNYGAFVNRGEDGETSARSERGRYFTTIWEYNAAIELGLCDNVEFNNIIDCQRRSDFAAFVVPTYADRQAVKAAQRCYKYMGGDMSSDFALDMKKDDMFLKFLLNNAYGKFAQNPRTYRESYITALGDRPPADAEHRCCKGKGTIEPMQGVAGFAKCNLCGKAIPTYGPISVHTNYEYGYEIWERPQKRLGFNNVGTAASITGAARSILMRGIANAKDAIYCDTDSIICSHLSGVPLSDTELGGWSIDDHCARVIIAGKKLYACDLGAHKPEAKRYKTVMKGGDGNASWADYERILDGAVYQSLAKGPTMTKRRDYFYMGRSVRATGPKTGNERLFSRRNSQGQTS